MRGKRHLRPLPGGDRSRPGVEARADRLSEPGPTETDYQAGDRWAPAIGWAVPPGSSRTWSSTSRPTARSIVRWCASGRCGCSTGRSRSSDSITSRSQSPTSPAQPETWSVSLGSLDQEWGLAGLVVDSSVLRILQTTLRQGGWAVTVAVRQGIDVIGIWPGFRDLALGVAFDVGSTTIAGHLCDLLTGAVLATNGAMNPQIGFGEDLAEPRLLRNDERRRRLTPHPSGARRPRCAARGVGHGGRGWTAMTCSN